MILKIDWCSSNGLDFEIKNGQTLSFECGNNVPSGLRQELLYITVLRHKYLWLKLNLIDAEVEQTSKGGIMQS